jgi:hypothetical protein
MQKNKEELRLDLKIKYFGIRGVRRIGGNI